MDMYTNHVFTIRQNDNSSHEMVSYAYTHILIEDTHKPNHNNHRSLAVQIYAPEIVKQLHFIWQTFRPTHRQFVLAFSNIAETTGLSFVTCSCSP